jgi:tetratricopeptide (TPR) repeat protein
LFASLCVLSLSLVVAAQESTPEKRIAHSRELALTGDQLGALQEYLGAIRKDPSLAEFREIRGFGLRRNLPDAKKEQMEPLVLEAARIYASQHRDEWAPVALMVELSPSDAADKLLSEWLTAHPKDWDALSLRAQVRVRRKHYDDAVADWETLLARHPDDPALHLELGSALVDAMQKDARMPKATQTRLIARAESALRRAIDLDPQSGNITAALVSALRLKAQATTDAAEKARITSEADALDLKGIELLSKAGLPKTVQLRIRQGFRRTPITDRDVVKLDRAPFTLEYDLDENVPVWINIYTADVIQNLVERGIDRAKECSAPNSWAFCRANFTRESPHNADENLKIGMRLGNNLYYTSASDHTWSEAAGGGAGAYRRVVSKLDGVPIADVKWKRLYFSSVADVDGDGRVDQGEVHRFTIEF